MIENLFVEAQFRAPQELAIGQVFSHLVAYLDEYSGTRLIDLDAGLDASHQMIYFSAEIHKSSSDELENYIKSELSQVMKSVLGETYEPELISINLSSGDQKLISRL